MMDYKLLGYGDYLQSGVYGIHSKFAGVSNFVSGDNLVSLVKKEIGNGPVNIVLENDFSGIDELKIIPTAVEPRTVPPLSGTGAWVKLNGTLYELKNYAGYCSGIALSNINVNRFKVNLAHFEKLITGKASLKSLAFLLDGKRKKNLNSGYEKEMVKRIEKGWNKILGRNYIEGIKLIKGAGYGFTPAGDDFIAGFLAGLHIRGGIFHADLSEIEEIVYSAGKSKNIITNNFIFLAKAGLFSEKTKDLMLSLIHGDEEAVSGNTVNLLSIGETSGADFSTGLICSFRNKTP